MAAPGWFFSWPCGWLNFQSPSRSEVVWYRSLAEGMVGENNLGHLLAWLIKLPLKLSFLLFPRTLWRTLGLFQWTCGFEGLRITSQYICLNRHLINLEVSWGWEGGGAAYKCRLLFSSINVFLENHPSASVHCWIYSQAGKSPGCQTDLNMPWSHQKNKSFLLP